MKLIVHTAARKEFDRKVNYLHRKGLMPNSAELFTDEIERALKEIVLETGKNRLLGTTRYFRVGPTPRFGYSVIYQISDETIEVLAISAPERRPGYWKSRKF
jgi:hypothetical protein